MTREGLISATRFLGWSRAVPYSTGKKEYIATLSPFKLVLRYLYRSEDNFQGKAHLIVYQHDCIIADYSGDDINAVYEEIDSVSLGKEVEKISQLRKNFESRIDELLGNGD